MMLDSPAEMPLGKTEIRRPEIFLAQTEVVVGILAKDLGYGDIRGLSAELEEVSKLLGAYTAAILASVS